jgi:hypothetical protein
MKISPKYTDIYGQEIDLEQLDAEERELVVELHVQAKAHPDPDTGEFFNYWMPRVGKFYEDRGLTRRQTIQTTPWKIAQDLDGKMMVKAGRAQLGGDYRDELLRLIVTKFGSRRAFCEATGLTEDMLSHVLAKRKNLAVQTLTDALGKIGYAIHIAPQTPLT